MPGAEPKKYQQRRPEKTVLYRIIQQHLESFLEHAHESSGKWLPKYVENEFRRYLECGLHVRGFARAVCETCGDELLLPFSCKLRGLCPSCNTRRMSNTAAHLVDHIIAPDVTLRQWVLTVPFELRLLLAAKPEALSAVGRIFIQEIQRWQRQQPQALGFEQPEGAAVSFCQRFGSSLNLNIHWHAIVPDALFVPDAKGEHVDTLKHRAPTRLDLEEIVTTVATRCVRWLEKHGYLRSDGEEDAAETTDTDSPWMRCLQGSLGVGELQRSAEHGPADENRDPARGRSLPKPTKGLGAEHLKFNLHAGVSVPGGLPAARERLIRYCARPPLALERLSVLEDGRICYRIKDTEQVRLMTPTQFMARLAALNSIEGEFNPYVRRCRAPASASPIAAVAAAAYASLLQLYPDLRARIESAYAASLAQMPDDSSKLDGVALGLQVAAELLALRASDGAAAALVAEHTPGDRPGEWVPTPPASLPALDAGWGRVLPFLLEDGAQFRPTAPPALDSRRYARDFDEIKAAGSLQSPTRTQTQTDLARFWIATGAQNWNPVARQLASARGLTLSRNARLFALLNLAGADAFIAAWDAKFAYAQWRPVSAIRGADDDGNPSTAADAAWTPLLTTPPFPDYIAGHTTYAGAVQQVLEHVFGRRPGISLVLSSPSAPGVVETYATVEEIARAVVDARVWGGIHWRTSSVMGHVVGKQIGRYAVRHFLTPTRPR